MIQTAPPFTVHCPSCSTAFPVDPGKVPEEGIAAICSTCMRVFRVRVPEGRPTDLELPEASGFGSDQPDEAVEFELPESEAAADPRIAPPEEVATSEAAEPAEATDFELPEPEEAADPRPSEAPAGWEDLSSLAADAMAESAEVEEGPEERPDGQVLSASADRFGQRDPNDRAWRLARVLVSDIIAYHPVRYQESLARKTLPEDFQDEIQKSWKEYVGQVGQEMAESTPYFNEALNEILARGEDVF